jgi:putative DNA methylase
MTKSKEQLAFYFAKTAVDSIGQRAPFPEEEANALAAMESYNKHLYRPNTYLHKWWARRCGTTFRYILKQFIRSPSRRDFYAPGGLEGIIVLDPMMGGGTTVHEAIRLGANVVGGDIDPIPVLQARATLTPIPETSFRATFREFVNALRKELAPYYATRCPVCDSSDAEFRFMLYALRRRCTCGEVLLVDSYTLRREARRTIQLCPQCRAVFDQKHVCHSPALDQRPLLEKRVRSCPTCGETYADLIELPFRQRYVPIAIAGDCPQHGLFFKSPHPDDLARLEQAEACFGDLNFGDREQFAVVPGPKSRDLPRLGIHHYLDLFSARQLGYIASAQRELQEIKEPAERLVLALLVSTSLEFNSMLCGYKGGNRRRPGAIRHTFSHHAYSFPYTAAENNPLFPLGGSGTLVRLFESRVVKARRWAVSPVERRIEEGKTHKVAITGERDLGHEVFSPDELRESNRRFFLYQGDSRHVSLDDASVDYIVTDPPYYDSVQYSDLAAFFRVWLGLFLPGEARWDYNTENSAVARGDGSEPSRYGDILGGIFRECRRVLKPGHGRLAFTFHHWRPRAWAELTIALKQAGFHLEEYYVIHSENPISVHIRTLRALKHDAVLVLAPATTAQDWSFPDQVNMDDSRLFTADCSAALGWLLDSNCSESEILRCWEAFLKGDNNDCSVSC